MIDGVYELVDSAIQKVCEEILVLKGIKSGDITPFQAMDIETAQTHLAESITAWIQSRIKEEDKW